MPLATAPLLRRTEASTNLRSRLCRCGAGFASSHMLDTWQHDTSTLTGPPSGASNHPEAGADP